jgi:AAA domain
MSVAADFLAKLRPGGPWVLTAIAPDGPTQTITANNASEVDTFVRANNGNQNLYYSVNPTRSAKTKKAAKADIAAVEYLLADLDPNEGESPSDAKSRYLAQLNGAFEPKPTVVVDSGNGIQCLWQVDEPIKLPPEATEIVANVEARSAALMLRLGGKPGTQNIDRILRLPGTTNLPNKKKRDAGRVVCPTALIEFNDASYSLSAFPPSATEANKQRQPEQKRPAVNVDELPLSDRMKDLIRGIDDPEHEYPSRSEQVMAVLVAMAAAGCTDDQMADVMLDKGLPIGEHVREQPKVFNYLTRQIWQARDKAGTPPSGEIKVKARLEDVLKSAADLQKKIFEELRWIVPNYLPEGLTVLGGRPKVGKSWFGLDTATAVSMGGTCLGEQCEEGDLLALMLEDSDRRLQRRLTRMLGAQQETWPERLKYATGWPRLSDGGLDWMREWIDTRAKPRLIIVDILERIRHQPARKDQKSQYSADYYALAALQELGTEAQLSILVMHHQRKLDAEDLIDTLSGTLGLGGAVDTVLILGKDQQFDKFLYGRGRDLEEFNVSVKQNEQCRWQVLGPRKDEQASPERAKIIAVLAVAGKPMNVRDISEAVGGKYDNVKNLLTKLHVEGQVERVRTGVYKLPDPQADLGGDIPF